MSGDLDAPAPRTHARRNPWLADVIKRGDVTNTIAFSSQYSRISTNRDGRKPPELAVLQAPKRGNTPFMRRVDHIAEFYPPSACDAREGLGIRWVSHDVHRLFSPNAYQCGTEERIHERASLCEPLGS